MPFYLVVSICEYRSFRRFSPFLTAGNKSYCGTLQHLTHPRQSTDSPILKPVSSSKRQVSQRKPFALSSISAQTSSHLRKHRTSVPSRPHFRPARPKVACNSRTGVTQRHEVIRTSKIVRRNCMRNCRAPHCAPRKVARNSPRTSFTNSSKTAEYQRSHFKTRNILKGITCETAGQHPCTPPRGRRMAYGSGRGARGRRQGQGGPRDRPLRAKLACGDLAGGPPPTGAPSSHTHTRQPQQATPRAAAAQ